MAFIVQGRKIKRPTTVLAKVLEAGAKSVRFCVDGSLEVEWESGVVKYAARQEGDSTRFDDQLDYDLKAS